jgi:type III restriction enzyme
LPIKSGTSSTFYPDFLWWVKDTVWAIDPTGKFILSEKIRAKLLTVPAPLRIALLTKGHLTPTYTTAGDSGWSLVRFRIGNAAPENFHSLDDLAAALVEES